RDGPLVGTGRGVLLLSAEDSLSFTIKPRLMAAGADLERIHILTALGEGDSQRQPALPGDAELIEEIIRLHDIRLVVIDPLMAYLGAEINAHQDHAVRRCLPRLKLLAAAAGAAVVVVRHLNKLVGGPALSRGGGSIGIIGACRAALVVGKHPKDQNRRVLAVSKMNVAAVPKAIEYSVIGQGKSSI